jgi:hypothetical protein
MRQKATLSKLLLIAGFGLVALPAYAQEAAAAGDSPKAAADAEKTDSGEKGDDAKGEDDPMASAPSLTVDKEAAKQSNKMPFTANASLNNSLGIGTFVPGTQRVPNWNTGLGLSLGYSLPKWDYLPKMRLGGGMNFSVPWLNSYNSGGALQRQLSYSDFGISLSMPAAVKTDWGLSVSPGFGISLPISMASRFQRRLTSARASASVSWSKYGFSVGWTPGIRGNANLEAGRSVPCGEIPNPVVVGNDADTVQTVPLVISREDEILENGRCIIPGRASMGGVSNTLSLGYSFLDDHSVSLSVGHSLGFLAPLEDNPAVQSEFASDQNFSESTSGGLGYSYSVPIDTPLSFSAGLSSGQPAFTMDGKNLRFPLFDFVSPGNNFTSFYLGMSVGI